MKVLIAGDYSPRTDLQSTIDAGKFKDIFGEVMPIVEQSDYSIVNFETTIADSDDQKIQKSGPHLKTNTSSIDALQCAGFDCVTLANNHFRDYGDTGVNKTIEYLDKCSIDWVGGGRSFKEASRVLYKTINNETLAIINACEHEFSIAEDGHGGCNPIDEIQQFYSITEARKKADYVVVIIHGGHEHFNLPSPRMKKTYCYFIDVGADAVINHHQHCFSGFEIHNGKPIFYGLGNFCFPSRVESNNPTFWNKGYMVFLAFIQGRVDFDIVPYIQCFNNSKVQILKDRDSFNKELKAINEIISDDIALEKEVADFYLKNQRKTQYIWEPYKNKITKALYYFHLLPSRVTSSGSKLTMFYNCLTCESHRDKMMCVLKKCAYAYKE